MKMFQQTLCSLFLLFIVGCQSSEPLFSDKKNSISIEEEIFEKILG